VRLLRRNAGDIPEPFLMESLVERASETSIGFLSGFQFSKVAARVGNFLVDGSISPDQASRQGFGR